MILEVVYRTHTHTPDTQPHENLAGFEPGQMHRMIGGVKKGLARFPGRWLRPGRERGPTGVVCNRQKVTVVSGFPCLVRAQMGPSKALLRGLT